MITITQLTQFVSRRALVFLLVLPAWVAGANTLTEADIRAQYDLDASLQAGKTEYLISQIVTSSEDAAKAVLTRIAAGESFEDVARSTSEDMASRSKGGDLGWGVPSRYFPEIESALLAMKPGQVSKFAVHTKLGWHVLMVKETRMLVPPSYESSHDRISTALTQRFDRIDVLAELLQQEKAAATQAPPSLYLISHILTKTEQEAMSALTRINAGESFADVARQVSIDTASAVKGGDLGWSHSSDFVPAFANSVKTMQKGAITQAPVRSPYGWHVIFVRDINVGGGLPAVIPVSPFQKELDSFFFTWPSGPAVIRHLIDAGANPNAVKDGVNALGVNCYNAFLDSVRLLLAAGADANLHLANKASALDGCIQGSAPMLGVPLLLDAGAHLNQPDGAGFYPLSVVTATNNPDLIRLFVQRGQSVDQHNMDGSTPLAVAAWNDSMPAIQTLLELGANPLESISAKMPNNAAPDTAITSAYMRQTQRKLTSNALPLLRKAASEAVKRRSVRSMTVFVVQDGKRHALDGHPMILKRAPFTLDFGLMHGDDVMVHASTSNETINHIQQNPFESEFGDETHVSLEDTLNNQTLVVSDASNFKYHHWSVVAGKSHLETQSNANGELKARRQVKTLRFEDLAHKGSDESNRMVDVARMDKPIYLAVAIGEPIGRPYFAVTQLLSTEIRWH